MTLISHPRYQSLIFNTQQHAHHHLSGDTNSQEKTSDDKKYITTGAKECRVAKSTKAPMTLRRAPVQITYNIGGTVLEHVDQIRDLGIIIDSKLTFAQHVDHAVKRANRALGLLMRSFQTGARPGKFRTSAVLTAYFANVRSILEYGSVIWAGAAETHTARIDRVQHKFLMWLLSYTLSGYAPSLSYENLLHHFRLP